MPAWNYGIIVNYDDTSGARGWVEDRRSPPLVSLDVRCWGYFNIDRKYDSNFVRVTYIRYEINYALQLVRRGTTATRLSVSRGYRAGFNSIAMPITYGHGAPIYVTKGSFIKDTPEGE